MAALILNGAKRRDLKLGLSAGRHEDGGEGIGVRTHTHAETLEGKFASQSLLYAILGQLPDFFCSTRFDFVRLLPRDAIQNGKQDGITRTGDGV